MKTKILSAIIFSTLFFSCSNDEGESLDTALLTRKWYIHSYIIDGETYPYDGNSNCGSDYNVFKTNGVFEEWEFYTNANQECVEEMERTATWSVSGTNLTVTFEGVSRTSNVIELTTESLKVNALIDSDGDGIKEDITEIYTSIP